MKQLTDLIQFLVLLANLVLGLLHSGKRGSKGLFGDFNEIQKFRLQ